MSERPFGNLASEPGEESNQADEAIHEITIEPATEQDIAEAQTWLEDNAEKAAAVQPPQDEAEPTETQAKTETKQKAWMFKAKNQPVAYFQLSSRAKTGNILFVVKPSMRGAGLGKRFLRQIEHLPDLDVYVLKAFVDEANIPGQRVLLASGYVVVGKKGRLIEFRKRIIEVKG